VRYGSGRNIRLEYISDDEFISHHWRIKTWVHKYNQQKQKNQAVNSCEHNNTKKHEWKTLCSGLYFLVINESTSICTMSASRIDCHFTNNAVISTLLFSYKNKQQTFSVIISTALLVLNMVNYRIPVLGEISTRPHRRQSRNYMRSTQLNDFSNCRRQKFVADVDDH